MKRRSAPANMIDPNPGTPVTVTCRLSKPEGFNGENAERTVELSWPTECFTAEPNTPTQKHSAAEPFVWVLTRNETPLPGGAAISARVTDITAADDGYEDIKEVTFGQDAAGELWIIEDEREMVIKSDDTKIFGN
jgi:hypothetical protein